jgi:tripartite-type tricarboxylate transporter receptor subunit TctC
MNKGFAVVFFLSCIVSVKAEAQTDYPSKPIRLIVPVAAGGNQEITARALADEMSKGLGQQIVVESRPSSSALVGSQFVARSAPDGYTLLSVSTTFSRAPALIAAAGYDPVRDFTAVSLVSRVPQVLVVNPSLPANSIAELIALAKSRSGQLSYASAGVGGTGHVAAELFNRMAGVKMLHIPYKGNAQALVDLLGGQVDLMFDQVSTSVSHVRAGKLRALGVTSKTRSSLFPDVPTIDEAGLKGYEDVTWNGVMAPAGTPAPIVQRLYAEIVKAVGNAELRRRFAERGIELGASASAAEFAAYLQGEVSSFAKLAKEANLKVD